MQKIFRILALLCFFSLILSPLYFKYIKHYLTSVRLENLVAENITDSFTQASNLCNVNINSGLQILHFFSLNCPSCAKELEDWEKFDLTIPGIKIQHLINKNSLVFPQSSAILSKLLTSNGSNKSLICLASFDEVIMEELNLDSLPYTAVVKNGVIVFSIAGRIDSTDLQRISAILTKYHD